MKRSLKEIIKSNNEHIEITNVKDDIVVRKCWNDDSFYFVFKSNNTMSFLKNIMFRKELFGIYHKDKKVYEFIYAPLQEEYKRSFEYIYQGKHYKLFYGQPSEEFQKLVKHFSINENIETLSDRYVGLARFYYYYQEKKNSMIPTNFFIEGDFDDNYNDHLIFFKHVNFIMSYYDRNTPIIYIHDTEENDIGDINVPCKRDCESFPQIINTQKIDTTLLELMSAARDSSSLRLKYIFYFQILEYCSYYYVENSLKRQVANIIKSPDILNSDKYSHKIIELFSDYFKSNKDDRRMERLINDLCSYNDIKLEIATNIKYFVDDICFDGGLTVKGLFNKADEIENPPKEIMSTIRKNIDTIRNVLVHARESRENVVISPTYRNSSLLRPYLYLLRRLAEVVIIKFQ